jgi:cholesterol oxidase
MKYKALFALFGAAVVTLTVAPLSRSAAAQTAPAISPAISTLDKGGGSVAALHSTEKRYCVAVMEAGRRWPDDAIPKSSWDSKDEMTAYYDQAGRSRQRITVKPH